MIKELLKKFGGAIFFYIAIFGMVMLINYRFERLDAKENNTSLAVNLEK